MGRKMALHARDLVEFCHTLQTGPRPTLPLLCTSKCTVLGVSLWCYRYGFHSKPYWLPVHVCPSPQCVSHPTPSSLSHSLLSWLLYCLSCISNPMLATLFQFTDFPLPSTMLYLSLVIAYMAKEIGREIKCAVDWQEDSPLNRISIHC